MFNQMGKFLTGVLLVSTVLSASGCFPLLVGAAAGAGGVVYIKGNLEKNFDYPVKDVHQASLDALKALNIIVTNDDLERHSAKISAQYDDGKKIVITVKALTERASNLRIRVGYVGDEVKSETLLNQIENSL